MSLLDLFRKKNAATGSAAPGNLSPVDILCRDIAAIQATPVVETHDNGNQQVTFDFQGGHFVIIVIKDTALASLIYPVIGEWDSRMLGPVRYLCNRMNQATVMSSMSYRLNVDTNKIGVDISLDLPVIDTPAYTDLLKGYINCCFAMQRDFVKELDAITDGGKRGDAGGDAEMASFDEARAEVLQSRIKAGEMPSPYRADGLSRDSLIAGLLTPAGIIKHAFGVDDNLVWTSISGDAPLPDSDTPVADTDLLAPLRDNPARLTVTWTLGVNDADSTRPATLVVTSRRIDRDDPAASTVRVDNTATLVFDPDPADDTSLEVPRPMTVRFFTTLDPDDALRLDREAEFMVLDAADKIAEGRDDDLTVAQMAAIDIADPRARVSVYKATRLFNDGRLIEALPVFESVFSRLQLEFPTMDDSARRSFLNMVFSLGLTHMFLGHHRDAYFYFDILFQTRRAPWVKAFISNLVDIDDFRVPMIIEAVLAMAGDRKDDPEWNDDFVNWLNINLAEFFIRRAMLDEAETILRPMLDIDGLKDTALEMMARIEEQRNNKS